MTNYRAILQYHYQGNTTTQVAVICQCSRTTVIKTVKRAKELNLTLPIPDSISDQQLYIMLYPRRGRKQEYYFPNWYELDKDKIKRGFTKYRAWQKYCRVAKKLGLKAYRKSQFYKMYKDYYSIFSKPKAKVGQNLMKIKLYMHSAQIIAQDFGVQSYAYQQFLLERDKWCKKLRLDKTKIWAT